MSRGGSFPDLTLVDLVDQATNLGCALTEEDIVRPTASKVQAIYGWFMQRFLGGLGIEEVNKATERQLDLMEEAVCCFEFLNE